MQQSPQGLALVETEIIGAFLVYERIGTFELGYFGGNN
jgi:hypothetical protein